MIFSYSMLNYKKLEMESPYVIRKKINERIEKLLELSIEDELNQNNVLMSKNKLLSFLEYINFYEYPKGVGLDDNGYFTLEIDRNDVYAVFIFREKLHFYYYKFKKLEFSLKIQNPEDFFTNINYTKYNELFKYKEKSNLVNYIPKNHYNLLYYFIKSSLIVHHNSYLKELDDKEISLYQRINTENIYAGNSAYKK